MFNRVSFKLNVDLSQLDICSHSCNVVEDRLLKLAGVNKKPSSCHFGGVGQMQHQTYFEINELTEEEAMSLLNFFKQFDENATLQPRVIEDNEAEEKKSLHHLEVGTVIFDKDILPLVVEDLKDTEKSTPQELEAYKTLTAEKNPKELVHYKIEYAVADIFGQLKGLSGQFTQGHLHAAFHYLSVMLSNCEQHITHGCGEFVPEVNQAIDLYNFAQENDNNLKENENAIRLKNSLEAFKSTLAKGINLFAANRRPTIQGLQIDVNSASDDIEFVPPSDRNGKCSIM